MTSIAYEIQLMRKEDIPQVLDIWREVGKHRPAHMLSTWLEVDPEGFYVAATDTGEVLGACCAVLHHKDLAYVGSYCVKKNYRGLGVGHKVWEACNKHIGPRNAALSCPPEMMELYKDECGFPIVENEWVGLCYSTTDILNVNQLADNLSAEFEIRPHKEADLPLMCEYFFNLMGYRLDLLIKLNCKEEESNTFVAIKDGACVGLGSIKISCCNDAGVVGPLYADTPMVAEVLLKRLILSLPQAKEFAITTVSSNFAANAIVQRLGFLCSRFCSRLYRKKIVKVDTNKVFAPFTLTFAP